MGCAVIITNGTGTGSYSTNYEVSISAYSPPVGYHFGWWNWSGSYSAHGNGSSESSSITTSGTNGQSCGASVSYVINSYTVQYYAGTGGSISGSTYQNVNYGGTTSQVTANADPGYRFTGWDDSNTNSSRTDGPVSSNFSHSAYFVADSPVVTSIDVTQGGTGGGTRVIFTGLRFTAATAVKFGTTDAQSYSVDLATQITAYTPAHASGLVDVSVTTSLGTGTKTNAYTFAGTNTNKDVAGAFSISQLVGVLTKAISKHNAISGGVTPTGNLTASFYDYSMANAKHVTQPVGGEVIPTGVLFAHKVRPIRIYAPFVPTVINKP